MTIGFPHITPVINFGLKHRLKFFGYIIACFLVSIVSFCLVSIILTDVEKLLDKDKDQVPPVRAV
jgi:hypothetical protein